MLIIDDVEITPNPQALKFILNTNLLKYESRNFLNKAEASEDPLASAVFNLEGIKSVYYASNFVTIEKDSEIGWNIIQKPFIELLKNFDLSLIPEEKSAPEMHAIENELMGKITELIDGRVRPALANDGGGLKIISLVGKNLTIHYEGACGGCPSAITGTLRAIEGLLKRDVDPDISVIAG